MKNILEEIILYKKEELKRNKATHPAHILEQMDYFGRKCLSLKSSLSKGERSGIIAEHKRKSPSKGIFNEGLRVDEVVLGYQAAGASAVSILTDENFFAGKNEDIISTRDLLQIPVLRKDFIIEEYQILEAKAIGADVILLIAACLDSMHCKSLAEFAKRQGLEVLLELHEDTELDHINEYIDMVGVNNRNLKTFEVSIENSIRLSEKIPASFVKIAESGLTGAEEIIQLRNAGFLGFLIGETFMKTKNPGQSCAHFIKEIEMAYPIK